MGLFNLHIELAVTNELLKRIADALDRLSPAAASPDHSSHPLIGLSDISRFDPARARQSATERATMPLRASQHVRSNRHNEDDADRAASGVGPPRAPEQQASVTGQWDHDDPLDNLEEFDREWSNYAGTDV